MEVGGNYVLVSFITVSGLVQVLLSSAAASFYRWPNFFLRIVAFEAAGSFKYITSLFIFFSNKVIVCERFRFFFFLFIAFVISV